MLVFWWTGRGYLTPVIILGTLGFFGIILQIGRSVIPDARWYWGAGIIVAASINWAIGRRANAKKLSDVRSLKVRDRLFYRARNRFMSLPLETWSIPMTMFGILYGASSFFR